MKQLVKISAFLPLAVTLIWLQFLPDRVPVHYDLSGAIDRWGSKWENLLLPGIVLLLGLVFLLAGKLMLRKAGADEKQTAHAEANCRVLRIAMIVTALMFTVLQAFLLYGQSREADSGAAQSSLPLNRVTVICLGVMTAVLGNFMSRTKRNSTIGFRCGWTMYNDVTWQKSNRVAGIAMMLAGLAAAIGVLFVPDLWAIPVFFTALSVSIVVSLIYARKIYREEKEKE